MLHVYNNTHEDDSAVGLTITIIIITVLNSFSLVARQVHDYEPGASNSLLQGEQPEKAD